MNQKVPIRVNTVKILSNSVSGCYYWHDLFLRKEVSESSKENLKDNKVKGYMSLKTSKLLKDTLNNWLSTIYAEMELKKESKYMLYKYLTFVTLTLPAWQIHTDYYVKRHMLNGFFKKLKRYTKRRNWIYCCEAQKNGNIHFHIVLDGMLHYSCIRGIWNSVLDTHGYIDRFEKRHGHRDPNSTDIHSFKKINNVGKYMTKYMTKESAAHLIEGRLWGCTDNLRKIIPYRDDIDTKIDDFMNEQLKNCKSRFYKTKFFYILDNSNIFKALRPFGALYKAVLSHYATQYSSLQQGVWHKTEQAQSQVTTCQTEVIKPVTLPSQGRLSL
jgi:hypothetical protein